MPGQVPVGLCLGGPHALLMLYAVGLSLVEESVVDPRLDDVLARADEAIELMSELAARSVTEDRAGPIEVLDAIGSPEGPAYCPLVFCYVTYSRGQRPSGPSVCFGDPPRGSDGRLGTVLGGAGLAVSSRVRTPAADAALRGVVRELVSVETQSALSARLGAQPARRSAWADDDLNRSGRGFFTACARSVDAAWLRPSGPGYVAAQDEASDVVRDGLRSARSRRTVVARLEDLLAPYG